MIAWAGSESPTKLIDEVGLLSGKTAIDVGRSAEMPIGGRAFVDWTAQPQMHANAARAQVEQRLKQALRREPQGSDEADVSVHHVVNVQWDIAIGQDDAA